MRRLLTLASAMMLALPLAAQTASEADAPAADAAAPTADGAAPVADNAANSGTRAATPREITRAVHGDWQIKCRTGEVQQCYLFQLILGPNDTPVLEYNLIPAVDETGEGVVLAATILSPLNTVLPRGVLMQIDENDPAQYEYTWCSPVGCFSRFGLKETDVAAYKNGSKITAVIFSMQNPQQGIEIDLSLNGFSAAYDELLQIEAEAKS